LFFLRAPESEQKRAEQEGGFFSTIVKDREQVRELLERLITIARPEAVYSEPLEAGDHRIITASEVSTGLGVGYGGGQGPTEENGEDMGTGIGGGGGGHSKARPVAVIDIGPEGVKIEPIVDSTKIALAFFAAMGCLFAMTGALRRRS